MPGGRWKSGPLRTTLDELLSPEPVLAKMPAGVWAPAYDADGQVRDGAFVAELTGLLDLSSRSLGRVNPTE